MLVVVMEGYKHLEQAFFFLATQKSSNLYRTASVPPKLESLFYLKKLPTVITMKSF